MSIDDTGDVGPAAKRRSGLTMKQIKRRIEKISTITDAKKAKSARRRLSHAVLAAIAEGTIADPRKAAAIVVAHSDEARLKAKAAKGAAADADDE